MAALQLCLPECIFLLLSMQAQGVCKDKRISLESSHLAYMRGLGTGQTV